MPTKSPSKSSASPGSGAVTAVDAAFDWRKIAYDTLVSRALDDVEEATNRNRASEPKEHLVLYQFSARGHDMAQAVLGSLLTGRHDAAGAYYRSRPLLLSMGLSIEDALSSPLGRAGGFSDGRDIGVVCNLARREGAIVLPMSGDVGSQYTPSAGWAQAITYYRDTLGDKTYEGCMSVALGGEGSVATNGFWSALTMATTLKLPMLFYIEDNGLGISVRGQMQTPGGDVARNLASFSNLLVRDGDGTDPGETSRLFTEVVDHVRAGAGPALIRLAVPRLCSHSGPDNQKGYRSDAEIAEDAKRDPLPKLRRYLVPAFMSEKAWASLEAEVARDVDSGLTAARARRAPEAETVKRFVYAEPHAAGDAETIGGLSDAERSSLNGSEMPGEDGDVVRFAEAVRRTLKVELARNPKVLVFGEDVGVKGGVHLVTEGLQKAFGANRVFDTSLSEEGIIGRAVGMAIAGLMPVAEIQFRKYADPATEQLNNCGTLRWRTNNQFAAPIVVRMPGGFGKDVGDPWHSLSDEVRFAHAIGWQLAMPSNSADAVGLLRSAMRGQNPTIFFEHRSLLMTSDGSAHYPGDDYVIPFGQANRLRAGDRVTVVSWGAMALRCVHAVERLGESAGVDLIDLRTIAPWDREAVLESVMRTGRCLIVHEDTITAGFGAEIAATVAREAFWYLGCSGGPDGSGRRTDAVSPSAAQRRAPGRRPHRGADRGAAGYVAGPALERLELVERLAAGVAEVDRFAGRRAELTPQLGLGRPAIRTGHRLGATREREQPALLGRRRRRDAEPAQLLLCLGGNPVARPGRRIHRLELHARNAVAGERAAHVLLHEVHGRTAGIGRGDRDLHPVAGHVHVADDAEFDYAEHRHFRVHDRAEDAQNLVAIRARGVHQLAPGCDRATICMSASMWPRNSECRPRRPPVAIPVSPGIVSVARFTTSPTRSFHRAWMAV